MLAAKRSCAGAVGEAVANPRTPRPLGLVTIALDNCNLANTLYWGSAEAVPRARSTL